MTAGVSIIICTYNGLLKLPLTLQHIVKLKSAFPWELIVVNNCSTDNTNDWTKHYLDGSGIAYRVLSYDIAGKMFAFWYGVENARYSYILDCDDDNHLQEDYLINGFTILESNLKIGALGGLGKAVTEIEPPDWFLTFSKSYAVGPQGQGPGKLNGPRQGLYGAGCFFRKGALDELKRRGFNSILSCRKGDQLNSGGDTELCFAIRHLGYEIWYSDQLKFDHAIQENRLSWDYYLKLKQGISASFPILESYDYKDFPTGTAFEKYLRKKWRLAWLGYLKTIVQLLFVDDRRIEVAKTICRTKIKVFKGNYRLALESFEANKRIFGNGSECIGYRNS